jgi:hypothetical protein
VHIRDQDCRIEKESKDTFVQKKYSCSAFNGINIDIEFVMLLGFCVALIPILLDTLLVALGVAHTLRQTVLGKGLHDTGQDRVRQECHKR